MDDGSGEGWNLEWGSVLQQNVTSRTDGREDIVNLYIGLEMHV